MSAPLRILMTADTVGGVWTYCLELAAALGDDVEILLATMGAPVSREQREQVERLPQVRLAESRYALEWMEEPWADVEAAGDWLLQLAADFQSDLVHLNGYAHAALPWEIPVLIVAHSCVLSWWRAVKGEAPPTRLEEYRRRVQSGLQSADAIVAPSAAMLMALREEYQFDTPAQAIPNCRSAGPFHRAEKQPVVFSAGRFWDEAKNTALLGRIAADLHWPVRLAGEASPQGSAKSFHLGKLSSGDLARELSAASIYAAPARYEPFGLSILEAALSGCALVLADLPSLRENWGGAALFLPPNAASGWRETLNELSEDAPARHRLAGAARERACRFSPERTVRGYRAIYAHFVQLRAASAGQLAAPAAL